MMLCFCQNEPFNRIYAILNKPASIEVNTGYLTLISWSRKVTFPFHTLLFFATSV